MEIKSTGVPNPNAAIFTPHWGITEDTRFANAFVCEDFVDHSVPPAERLFTKGLGRAGLLSDMCNGLVTCISNLSALRRLESELIEDQKEFLVARAAFGEERKRFVGEKEGLLRRQELLKDELFMARGELADAQLEAGRKQKAWEEACQRSNAELERAREATRKA